MVVARGVCFVVNTEAPRDFLYRLPGDAMDVVGVRGQKPPSGLEGSFMLPDSFPFVLPRILEGPVTRKFAAALVPQPESLSRHVLAFHGRVNFGAQCSGRISKPQGWSVRCGYAVYRRASRRKQRPWASRFNPRASILPAGIPDSGFDERNQGWGNTQVPCSHFYQRGGHGGITCKFTTNRYGRITRFGKDDP